MSRRFGGFFGRYNGSRALFRLLLVGAVVFTSLWLLGCESRPPSPPTAAGDAAETDSLLMHDFGRAWSGSTLSHEFVVRNPTGRHLALRPDQDIKKSCGCLSVAVSTPEVLPGGAANVSVTIRLPTSSGAVSHMVDLCWRSPGGQEWHSLLQLRGESESMMSTDTPFVSFTGRDFDGTGNKTVRVTSRVPVDWATSAATVSNRQFSIEPVNGPSQADERSYELRCKLDPDVESVNCVVKIVARRLRGVHGAGGDGEAETVTQEISVVARRELALSMTPSVLLATLDDAKQTATVRALLAGRLVKQDSAVLVKSVKCEGSVVNWEVSKAEGGSHAVLSLTFKASHGKLPSGDGKLVLEVAGHDGPFTAPVVFVGARDK